MTGDRRPIAARDSGVAQRLAAWLVARRASANGLSLLANLLDGMVAMGRGVASPVGELFNEVADRVSDTAILLGLGWAAGNPALPVRPATFVARWPSRSGWRW